MNCIGAMNARFGACLYRLIAMFSLGYHAGESVERLGTVFVKDFAVGGEYEICDIMRE